jgi:hypothetical protein
MCQRAPPVELTVALDATLWDEPTTGIGRYGRAVAGALEARGVRVLRVGARRSGELPRRVRSRTLHTLAELPRVLPRSGASVFHAVANVDLPLLRVPGVPFVLTVHDLIPLTSPRTVSRAFHWQFRLWLARSLRVADHVVCVSAWTQEQLLLRHPELDPERVSVVHNGVDHVQPRALDPVSQAGCGAWGSRSAGSSSPGPRRPEEPGAGAGPWSGSARARPPWSSRGSAGTARGRSSGASVRSAPSGSTSARWATSPSRCSGP